MPRNPKEYVKCRRCDETKRTRKQSFKDSKVCDECIVNSVQRNLPTGTKSKASLEHGVMRERWWHELLYRQVEHNGLQALNMGRLSFLDEDQRSEKRLGKWIDDERNEYDMLLKTTKGGLVVVEIKRSVDEATVLQGLRYRNAVRRLRDETPVLALVGCEIQAKAMTVVDELREAGIEIRVYKIAVGKTGFELEEAKG